MLSTNTLDSAIAPAANTGDSRLPLTGYRSPGFVIVRTSVRGRRGGPKRGS
ncbi:Uncharacterised protein [Bordetella pertussis]|nr:Uncharacterised protein [Bordetella pertussis]